MERPNISFDTIVIDCSEEDVKKMMDFYVLLTGFIPEPYSEDVIPTLTGKCISISLYPVKSYIPPTFPSPAVGRQLHLDFFVTDLESAVSYARSIGAVDSPKQYHPSYHIMLDPSGHPFCLTTNGPTVEVDF
jgi:hypothetical protein